MAIVSRSFIMYTSESIGDQMMKLKAFDRIALYFASDVYVLLVLWFFRKT